jgi:hypothetical protein
MSCLSKRASTASNRTIIILSISLVVGSLPVFVIISTLKRSPDLHLSHSALLICATLACILSLPIYYIDPLPIYFRKKYFFLIFSDISIDSSINTRTNVCKKSATFSLNDNLYNGALVANDLNS